MVPSDLDNTLHYIPSGVSTKVRADRLKEINKRDRKAGMANTGNVLFLVLLTVFISRPLPAAKECTFESLTRGCSLFDPERGDRILLPDGTFIPNFSAMLKVKADRRLAQEQMKTIEKVEEERAKLTQLKFETTQILDSVPVQRLQPFFKLYFIDNFLPVLTVLFNDNATQLKTIRFLWPPEGPRDVQAIPIESFRSRILGFFSAEQIDRLKAITLQAVRLTQENIAGLDKPIFRDMKYVTQARQVYIKKMAEFAKHRIIELIRQNRTAEQLSFAERQAVIRVETVKFTSPSSPVLSQNPFCAKPVPNAFYDRATHSINVCPNFYNFPDSTILSVVAHEIAHTIDPCFSQFPTYKIQWRKLAELEKTTKSRSEMVGDNDRYLLYTMLKKLPEGTELTGTSFPLYVSTAAISYFEKRGVLENQALAVPFAQYVLKDVYDCLKTGDGGGFRGHEVENIRRVASEVAQVRTQFREPTYDPKSDEQAIVDAFSKYPECVGIDRYSQMGEATSDWLAARVLGDFLVGMSLESEIERLGPVAYFGNLVCMERFRLKTESAGGLGAVLQSAKNDYLSSMEAHPGSRDRIEKIYLRDDQIRNALGCTASEVKACEHKLGSRG